MPTATIGDKTYPLPDNFDQVGYDRQQEILGALERQHMIAGPKSPDQGSGAVLPLKRTGQGDLRPGWGAVGSVAESLYDFAKLPGDAVNRALGLNAAPFGLGPRESGEPVIDPLTGRPSAAFTDRATNFAGTANLTSPASIAGRRQMMPTPTTQELAGAGGGQLDMARSAGTNIGGGEVQRIGDDLLAQYRREARIVPQQPGAPDVSGAPKSGGYATGMQNYAGDMPVSTLMEYRKRLTELAYNQSTDPTEAGSAKIAIQQIDRLFDRLPQVQTSGGTIPAQDVADIFRMGNANIAASKRSNLITGENDPEISGLLPKAELQAGATYSGRNLDNVIRQKAVAALTSKDVLGYSADEVADLTQIAKGTATQNQLRLWSNRLGGGGGMGQGVAATSAGGSVGAAAIALGIDPATAAALGFTAGGVVGKAGDALKALQNKLAAGNVRTLDEKIRVRSPMGEQKAARQDPATSATGYGGNLSARDAAILHVLAPGLLAPPAPPAEEPSWRPGQRLPRGYI